MRASFLQRVWQIAPAQGLSVERKQKVLVVDALPEDLDSLLGALEPECEVVHTGDASRALSLAQRSQPDLIILDTQVQESCGLELCKAFKQDLATSSTPIVFVTSKDSDALEADALRLGAIDYIVRPLNPLILRARIRNYLTLAKQRKQLEQMASQDVVTGIANRRVMEMHLHYQWDRLQMVGKPLAILLVDVDEF